MGLYDPERDSNTSNDNEPKTINSVSITDPFYRALSKTNDLTISSLDSLKSIFNRDVHGDFNKFNDIMGKITGTINAFTTDPIVKNPNELITETVPPVEAFEKCQELKGLGVWDQQGLWHCLFPRSIIPYTYNDSIDFPSSSSAEKLLSREDVENDTDHEHGVWFQSLQDLLSWQSQMKKVIKAKKEQQWREWKERESNKWSAIWDDPTTNSNNSTTTTDLDDKRIVSRQMESRMRSIGDSGDLERVTIEKRTYNDGSKTQYEKTEILAPNGEIKSVNERNS